ncbi:MAG: hypothetical protein CHACPFDD_03404 [Phycisphaerae bacterium]|nr:hypothetical protein [Phycisphaerae bacterium]
MASALPTELLLRKPVGEETLRELVRRIAQLRSDACIILFGSRARGDARPGSDLDLMVITQADRSPLAIAGDLYAALADRDFGLDIVVMPRDRVRRARDGFDPFLNEVLAQGRVLHGRLH